MQKDSSWQCLFCFTQNNLQPLHRVLPSGASQASDWIITEHKRTLTLSWSNAEEMTQQLRSVLARLQIFLRQIKIAVQTINKISNPEQPIWLASTLMIYCIWCCAYSISNVPSFNKIWWGALMWIMRVLSYQRIRSNWTQYTACRGSGI